jgi:hypothetical protein
VAREAHSFDTLAGRTMMRKSRSALDTILSSSKPSASANDTNSRSEADDSASVTLPRSPNDASEKAHPPSGETGALLVLRVAES